MTKFMQMIDPSVYAELEAIAEERGISVQELIRAIIIPEWLKSLKTKQEDAEGQGSEASSAISPEA
jgi:Ribbon-helix-helix protein, copG family